MGDIFEEFLPLSLQPLAVQGLEKVEQDLLQELKRSKSTEAKQHTPTTPTPYVDFGGLRYNVTQGDIAGNSISLMIVVAVGDRFAEGLAVEQRNRNSDLADRAVTMHGRLPEFVTGLHKEAAADLIATASNDLRSSNVNLVRICIDSPALQRSKAYYLQTIANFFKTAEHPVGKLNNNNIRAFGRKPKCTQLSQPYKNWLKSLYQSVSVTL